MKSITMRVRRVLPAIVIAVLAVTIGILTTFNINLISERASASTTGVEVKIAGEVIWPPTVLEISPNHGSFRGGTLVVFKGSGLDQVQNIAIGGAECIPITIISPEEITCITTEHTSGPVDIVLSSDAGVLELHLAYTYDPVIPKPPETGGDEDIIAPGTGMFLLGTAEYFTLLDIVIVSFIGMAIIGISLYFLCIPIKRKRATKKNKSTKRKKTKTRK